MNRFKKCNEAYNVMMFLCCLQSSRNHHKIAQKLSNLFVKSSSAVIKIICMAYCHRYTVLKIYCLQRNCQKQTRYRKEKKKTKEIFSKGSTNQMDRVKDGKTPSGRET